MKKYLKFIPFLFTIIIRIPDFFQPYWYTDTGIYSSIGQSLNHGGVLYKNIIDNKPLLIYYVYAYLEKIPISLMYSTQAVSLLLALGTEFLIYKIANLKFNYKISLLSCSVFAILVGSNILHSNGANVETFFMFFAALSVYIYFLKEYSYKYIYIAGLILGLGVLFKVSVLFDGFFLILYIFFSYKFGDFFKRVFLYSLGVITPVIFFLLYELSIGNLYNTVKYTFLNNFSYVAKFNKFAGVSFVDINIIIFILLVSITYYFYKKGNLTSGSIFLILWTLSDAFITVLTGRPYVHYILQLALPLSFLFGYSIYSLFYMSHIKKFASIVMVIIFSTLYFMYFFRNQLSWQTYDNFSNTIPFYTNFISYADGKISKQSYYDLFSYNTNVIFEKNISTANINYKMANLVNSANVQNKDIFLAANFPWVYDMTNSYSTYYYTTDFLYSSSAKIKTRTLNALKKHHPYAILYYNDGLSFPGFFTFLNKHYYLYKSEDGGQLYKLK
jgi:hypothetical protein